MMPGTNSVATAAGCAERGDAVEQPVLGLRRQIDQPTLGQPGGRCRRVQPGRPQRSRPVVAQVDPHGAAVGGRGCAEVLQGAGLELDHLWLVDLVNHRAVRPGQSVGTRVQTRREYHRLPHPAAGSLQVFNEVIVEILGAHRHSVDHRLKALRRGVLDRGQIELTVQQLGEEIQPDRAHQRFGELIVDQTSGIPRRHGALGRGEGRGGADAGGQIPIVVVSAWHGKTLTKRYLRVAAT